MSNYIIILRLVHFQVSSLVVIALDVCLSDIYSPHTFLTAILKKYYSIYLFYYVNDINLTSQT